MELKDIMIRYRKDNDLSQREFAKKCGLSHGTISALEKGINPNTGEPIKPTWESVECIAEGMGISVNTLVSMAGQISTSMFEDDDFPELALLNAAGRNLAREFVMMLARMEEYKKTRPAKGGAERGDLIER